MNLLEISESRLDEWIVIQARGEVDVASSPARSRALTDAISVEQHVITDLSGVSFIDSTGLGVLVQALNESIAAGVQLRLVITDPNVLKVFEVTALDGGTVEPPPEIGVRWRSDYISGIGRRGDDFVIVFDLGRLLGSDEAALIAARLAA